MLCRFFVLFSVLLLFCFFPVIAGERVELPEIIAEFGGVQFKRDDVIAVLRQKKRIAPESGRAELILLLRREVEEQVWFSLIRKMLAEAEIEINEAGALAYLNRLDAALPGEGIPGIPRSEFAALAAEPGMQLKAALYEYFRRTDVEAIRVTGEEIEIFYNREKNRFQLPAQLGVGVIEIPYSAGKEAAETVRARLLQGENFFRVAAEVNPEGATTSSAEILEKLHGSAAHLSAGSIAPVFGNGKHWFVVRINQKEPVRYIPLAEAAPYLREELAAAKTGSALEQKLRATLEAEPVRFYFDGNK